MSYTIVVHLHIFTFAECIVVTTIFLPNDYICTTTIFGNVTDISMILVYERYISFTSPFYIKSLVIRKLIYIYILNNDGFGSGAAAAVSIFCSEFCAVLFSTILRYLPKIGRHWIGGSLFRKTSLTHHPLSILNLFMLYYT